MDFSVLMLILLVIAGAVWGLDRLIAVPARRRSAQELERAGESAESIDKARREPIMVEYARAFFPVILIVFVLRAFIAEPFRIPSGSMMPSLLAGDFILVSKSSYGIRFPGINIKLFDNGSPRRGDVMVFRYPDNPSVNYIKRTIGLPGDHIVYRDKRVYINGKLMPQELVQPYLLRESGERLTEMQKWTEDLGEVQHDLLKYGDSSGTALEYKVPEGHYFVLGDNRDRSNDSRYWGFVPEDHLIGRAFMIWFSWDLAEDQKPFWNRILWGRIGNAIR
jgi:signal peptidase I